MKTTNLLLISMFALLTATTARADVEINETTFPDETFRNWVLHQSYGQDGVLTKEEIAGVKTVNVMGREVIQSLKGIEYFTSVTNLACGMNQLTELDLSKNTKLTSLECNSNWLTELDVSMCTGLTELDCGNNHLTTLNASGCSALTVLKCPVNQLSVLDMSGCTSLTTIWCFFNDIKALDVSDCTALQELSCYDNQLTQLDVSNNTKLTKLLCFDNQLTVLNLSENKQLTDLRTYNNQIKGERMDALIENLPIVSRCSFCPVYNNDEVDVMNAAQAAAAKAKGFIPYYWNKAAMRWMEYTGEVLVAPVTFTKDQMATIILPTAPDASKGKYYKLDKCEDGQIIFKQEPQPQARTPYIIVPNEDFSIDLEAFDLSGLSSDTVSFDGISFIGSYVRMELPALTGGDGGGSSSSYYDIIDTTPDCLSVQTITIGALRAYLVVNWNDPITPGGTRSPMEKMEIVLLDEGTGISDAELLNDKGQMINDNSVYNLSGQLVGVANGKLIMYNGQLKPGIYIVGGKKILVK